MNHTIKAGASDYGLGPHTFPRGWFVVAEAGELQSSPVAVTFFGRDFVLYRGSSGQVVMLDAYCRHMRAHLAKSTSAHITKTGANVEGDSIRCPYHGWKYGADGKLEEIPYEKGFCPERLSIGAYPVRELMGCILMWHDPEGGEPDYEPPYLPAWETPGAIPWELDHLGEIAIHQIEILDNMADVHHLGPTHGSPCEYLENEFRGTQVIQRQGGFIDFYQADLKTVTWYTGPGILLSKQQYLANTRYEFIANTPVQDGLTKAWHGVLTVAQTATPTAAEIETARQEQAGALATFSADFEIWKHKEPAVQVIQTPHDGRFRALRKWVKQFYMPRGEALAIQRELDGILPVPGFPDAGSNKDGDFEADCFGLAPARALQGLGGESRHAPFPSH
ncbi:Rieske 2Fe-2S domain-containing protein [Parahaliea mediterranea]|uniref:Rieske (2Fe-2S) protein n=1 Tax=Parahaliea mediterranea TaxID=651086 RepID=A0A939IL96_9GAMM|nr:Rieske 2Fe-2S domain-containing protein [Parahaliea mediterranea]MBN7795737.1 Rieske (2Fe-2S) protein [Parahaliea mediterranea]